MKITKVQATPVAVPFRRDEVWAFGRRHGLVSVLLEVHTDEGLVGLGEAAAYPSTDIVLAVLRSIEPLVLGADPFEIERLWRRIDLVGTWHHVRASSPAIAAVEMACWDILGKACGQPLVNLFGGRFRDRVEALRDGAGPQAKIRVDANEAWSPGEALRVIRELQRFDLELVEQPVSGRVLSEMAYLRGRIDVPLLANEASWTRHDQLAVIKAGAADVLSVDKHSLGELGVALAAAVHVIASTPNFRYANQAYGALLADDITAGFGVGVESYVDGCVPVPTGPGLGVHLDPDRVQRYAELYARSAADFAFTDPRALTSAHALPKR